MGCWCWPAGDAGGWTAGMGVLAVTRWGPASLPLRAAASSVRTARSSWDTRRAASRTGSYRAELDGEI